jgi:hypothetical protein
MKHRPAVCLAIALLTLAASRPTAASVFTTVFDTVDTVEVNVDLSNANLVIQGIPAGGSTPITRSFNFGSNSNAASLPSAARCERLALAVISKPGKYQLAFGTSNNGLPACKLILVTP